jgi:hypothetical protein
VDRRGERDARLAEAGNAKVARLQHRRANELGAFGLWIHCTAVIAPRASGLTMTLALPSRNSAVNGSMSRAQAASLARCLAGTMLLASRASMSETNRSRRA